MKARELLTAIKSRGGTVTIKIRDNKPIINVAPRSLALELLPDIQRFTPQLLEMLTAEELALAELAHVRETRRFDFQNGRRTFHPQGRFVALNAELLRLWRKAIEVCGPLSVWGAPPESLAPIPEAVPKHGIGAAWLQAERRFPDWNRMTTDEKLRMAACVALLDHNIDPDEIFPAIQS